MTRTVSRSGSRRALLVQLRHLSGAVLADIGRGSFSTEIAILPEGEMQRLKRRFLPREKKREAEVLSFACPPSFPSPESGGALLGEVYLNEEYAAAPFRDCARLLVHGILHLAGYDHATKHDMMVMEREERRIMAHCRISPPRRGRQ